METQANQDLEFHPPPKRRGLRWIIVGALVLLIVLIVYRTVTFMSQAQAVASAKLAADVSLNEFNAGTVAYTTVVTAQQTLLGDEQSELSVEQNRLVAAVTLIQALGGGWDTSQLWRATR